MNIAANLIALACCRRREVVAALGAGFGLANVVGAVLAWRVLAGASAASTGGGSAAA